MKSLREEFTEEVRCYNYCTKEAGKRIYEKDYIGAAVFTENAKRSLEEMGRIRKEMEDLKNGKVMLTTYVYGFGNNHHG